MKNNYTTLLFAFCTLLVLTNCTKKTELPSHCMNISDELEERAEIAEIALNQGIEYDIPNGCIVKGEVPETITSIQEFKDYVQQQNEKQ